MSEAMSLIKDNGVTVVALVTCAWALGYLFKLLTAHFSNTINNLTKQNDALTMQIIEQQKECKKCKEDSTLKAEKMQESHLGQVGDFYSTMRSEMKDFYNGQQAVDAEVNGSLVGVGNILKELAGQFGLMLERLKDIKDQGGIIPPGGFFGNWRRPWTR